MRGLDGGGDFGAGTTVLVGVDGDIGEGSSENALGDVYVIDTGLSYSFGVDADFVCNETGCS